MPPASTATQRKKGFHSVLGLQGEMQHGHPAEYLFVLLGLGCNIAFLAGSIMFLTYYSGKWGKTGDWCFIIGSAVNCLLSMHAIRESGSLHHVTDMLQLTGMKNRKVRSEFMENVAYLLSGKIFFLASFLFMPGIYGANEAAQHTGERIGAIAFVVGSYGFVMASFFTCVEMAADADHQNLEPGSIKMYAHYWHCTQILCAQLGSVSFAIGSVLYRPAVGAVTNDDGTWFYIAGSVLYVIDSLITLRVLILKHGKDGQELSAGDKLIGDVRELVSSGRRPPGCISGRR